MVDNEQAEAAADGVGGDDKFLGTLKSNLIRICNGTAVVPRRGRRDRAGRDTGIRRWLESAFRSGQSVDERIEALTRKPELDATDVFSAGVNDHFLFVIRNSRRLHLR